MSELATPTDHDREIARIHRLIEHIQVQADELQKATHDLPQEEAQALSDKADELQQTADELLDEVEALEQRG